jgi:hypothetical protein
MSVLLLIAFGLVAFGSVLRLILFFTEPKNKTDMAGGGED